MIKTIKDLQIGLEKLRTNGVVRGETTGFSCLDSLYSVKQGTFTIVYSEPTHGKSEFIFEICFNQAEKGKRSLICSPETGTSEEIAAELIHKHTGKKIFKDDYSALTDKEFYSAIEWLDFHFVIVDADERSYSVEELFSMADDWEKTHPGQKINIIVGEPYNELNHDRMRDFGGRQDLYIEDLMTVIRRACRKNKRHFFLSIHPSGTATPVTEGKKTFYAKPLPRQAAGGQALYRKSMTWITLWRPPLDYHGSLENEVHVFVDKAKPKGVSFKGMCKLFFDWKKNRYYETLNGINLYANDHLKKFKTLDGGTVGQIFSPESSTQELPF